MLTRTEYGELVLSAIGVIFGLIIAFIVPMTLLLIGRSSRAKVLVLCLVLAGIAVMAPVYRFAWLRIALLAADGMEASYYGRYAGGFVWLTAFLGVLLFPFGLVAWPSAQRVIDSRGKVNPTEHSRTAFDIHDVTLALFYGAIVGAVSGIVWKVLSD